MKVGDITMDGRKVGWIDLALLEDDDKRIIESPHADIGADAPLLSPGEEGGRGGSGRERVPADDKNKLKTEKGPTFRPGITPRGRARPAKPPEFSTDDVKAAVEGRAHKGIDRSQFEKELRDKPWLREKILRIAANEQGAHPEGTQAIIESMMNRAQMRGTNLETQARWHRSEGGYYDEGNMGRNMSERQRALIGRSLDKALAGSNISNYATDNSSGGLAAREAATGKFVPTGPPIHGETFFRPGWAEKQYRDVNYPRWRETAEVPQTPRGVTRLGPDPEDQARIAREEAGAATAAAPSGPRSEAAPLTHPPETTADVGVGTATDLKYIAEHGGHSSHMEGGRIVPGAPGAAMGVNPEFVARLAAAGRAYKVETGQEPQYGEMDRPADVQAIYYARHLREPSYKAAAPGHSRHQQSIAVDVPATPFREWLYRGGAARYGLHFPVRGDAPHMELNPRDVRTYAAYPKSTVTEK